MSMPIPIPSHARPMQRPAPPARTALGRALPTATMAAVLALLSACGGGNGDGGADDGGGGGTAAGLTLTGTAATGAAIANAPVQAKCAATGAAASGTSSASGTTASDGNFTLALPVGAALPCALKVTGASGSHYSLATGSGRSARVNLTPLTTLAVARLASGSATTYFDSFGADAAAALTAEKAQQAAAAVQASLLTGGLDMAAAGDPFASPLVPANGSTPGDAHDRALDALATTLASTGTTFTELAAALARASGAAAPTVLSATPTLPAELLLRPKASSCAALRSGAYRSLDLENHQEGDGYPMIKVRIDAAALTSTDVAINETSTLVPVPGAPCRFTVDDGVGTGPDAEAIVSGAGVIVIRYLTQNVNGVWRAAVLVPEQSHTLADLQGDWNNLGFWRDRLGDPYTLLTNTFTLTASGSWSNHITCDGLATGCGSEATTTAIASDGSGQFYLNTAHGERLRLWAYRAGGGEMMLIAQTADGGMSFFTRRLARTLPAVGDVSVGWQLSIVPSATGTASFTVPGAVNPYQSTTTATSGTQYTRSATSNFIAVPNVTRPETLTINSPRDGYLHRLGATGVVQSDGSTGTVSEWVGLVLRGMGITPVGLVASNQLVISVNAAQ